MAVRPSENDLSTPTLRFSLAVRRKGVVLLGVASEKVGTVTVLQEASQRDLRSSLVSLGRTTLVTTTARVAVAVSFLVVLVDGDEQDLSAGTDPVLVVGTSVTKVT